MNWHRARGRLAAFVLEPAERRKRLFEPGFELLRLFVAFAEAIDERGQAILPVPEITFQRLDPRVARLDIAPQCVATGAYLSHRR